MNRIILIGNGFDLAHEMPTSYKNFIDDYWATTINKIVEFRNEKKSAEFNNEDIIIKNIPLTLNPGDTFLILEKKCNDEKSSLIFLNLFLEVISHHTYLRNWVDIEKEYYIQLKDIMDIRLHISGTKSYIIKLNKDFNLIKMKLRDYLSKVEKEFVEIKKFDRRIVSSIKTKIFSQIDCKEISEESLKRIIEDMVGKLIDSTSTSNDKDKVKIPQSDYVIEDGNGLKKIKLVQNNPFSNFRNILLSSNANESFYLFPEKILFLNFNYTYTETLYNSKQKIEEKSFGKELNTSSIHIHGSIYKNDKNPIIFGFGDELDEDYKSIEKLNDNNYLENIKSIKYLESDNYKKLLEFINSDYYQVFVMGHSCGISDRTLLNTLFEHSNCVSIKVFYHQQSEEKDNFSDIIRNISRSFNNKAQMRDRVVNKKSCEALLE